MHFIFEEQLAKAEERRLELLGGDARTSKRATHLYNKTRSKKRRLTIIGYPDHAPHVGCLQSRLVDGKWVEGTHITYPKNSMMQRYLKRYYNRKVRHAKGMPVKGNHYRKVAEYWWSLY